MILFLYCLYTITHHNYPKHTTKSYHSYNTTISQPGSGVLEVTLLKTWPVKSLLELFGLVLLY